MRSLGCLFCSCQTSRNPSFLLLWSVKSRLWCCARFQKTAKLLKTIFEQFPPLLPFSPFLHLRSPSAEEGHQKLETCRHVNMGLLVVRAELSQRRYIYMRRSAQGPTPEPRSHTGMTLQLNYWQALSKTGIVSIGQGSK
jgi:hypothetical protein